MANFDGEGEAQTLLAWGAPSRLRVCARRNGKGILQAIMAPSYAVVLRGRIRYTLTLYRNSEGSHILWRIKY